MQLKLSNCFIRFNKDIFDKKIIKIEHGNTETTYDLGDYDFGIEFHRNFAIAVSTLLEKLKEQYSRQFSTDYFKVDLSELNSIVFLTMDYVNGNGQKLLEKAVRLFKPSDIFRYYFQYVFDTKFPLVTSIQYTLEHRCKHLEQAMNFHSASKERYMSEDELNLTNIGYFLDEYFKFNL